MPTPEATKATYTALPTPEECFALLEHLAQGKALGPAMGHSVGSLEALYHLAYSLYNQAKYLDAMRIFAYLLKANHMDRRFFNGLAACMHMRHNYPEAIKYYHMASVLDLTDPEAPMHMAECHLALGDLAQARNCLDYGLTQARGHKVHHGFVDRLSSMLEFLDAGTDVTAPTLDSRPPPTHADRQMTGENK
jgi:type III secretion system low calcium response chaperone LcrH/SycD